MIFILTHLMCLLTMIGSNIDLDKEVLTCRNFELIKKHILTHGNRLTYCNRYNDNPHYNLKKGQLYLNPSYFRDADHQFYTVLVIKINDENRTTYYDISCNKRDLLVVKNDRQLISSSKERDLIADIFKEMLAEQKEGKRTIRIDSPFLKMPSQINFPVSVIPPRNFLEPVF